MYSSIRYRVLARRLSHLFSFRYTVIYVTCVLDKAVSFRLAMLL